MCGFARLLSGRFAHGARIKMSNEIFPGRGWRRLITARGARIIYADLTKPDGSSKQLFLQDIQGIKTVEWADNKKQTD